MKTLFIFSLIVLLNVCPALAQGLAQSFYYFHEVSLHAGNSEFGLSDLDNDGDLDIYGVSEDGARTFWVENVDGEFSRGNRISTIECHPSSIASGDIDGDGWEDLLVYAPYNNFYLYRNLQSNGSFSEAIPIEGVVGPGSYNAILIADLDNDGDNDLIQYSRVNGTVVWNKNNGQGEFESQSIVLLDIERVETIEIADMDNDNDLDLVLVSYDNDGVFLLRNNGVGGFGSAEVFASDLGPMPSVKVADFNNDGLLDILPTMKGHSIYWLENDTTSFIKHSIGTVSLNTMMPYDLNADGLHDVLIQNSYGELHWIKNNGNGQFSGQAEIVSPYHPLNTGPMLNADLDLDGRADLLIGSTNIAYGKNSLNSPPLQSPEIIADNVVEIVFSDINGDGLTDVLGASWVPSAMSFFRNQGDGTFDEPSVLVEISERAESIAAGDISGDGYPELFWVDRGNNPRLRWFVSSGPETYESLERSVAIESLGDEVIDIRDLDGDGDNDVLLGPGSLDFYRNNGTGGLEFHYTILVGPPRIYAGTVRVVDINNDGNLDIACSMLPGDVVWCKNNGSGNFAQDPIQIVPLEYWARKPYFEDFDNDGDMDLALPNYVDYALHDSDTTNGLLIYKNDGTGVFDSVPQLGAQQTLYGQIGYMDFADMDDDGDIDIIAHHGSGLLCGDSELTWYENDGDGIFQNIHDINTWVRLTGQFEATDVNMDGDIDIMIRAKSGVGYIENMTFLSSEDVVDDQNGLTAYPNPVSSILRIKSGTSERVNWQVYTLSGTLIKSGESRGSEFDISMVEMSTGLYLIKLVSDGNAFHLKVFKE